MTWKLPVLLYFRLRLEKNSGFILTMPDQAGRETAVKIIRNRQYMDIERQEILRKSNLKNR